MAGKERLLCGSLPCWAQDEGGRKTGRSGFSQGWSGLRRLGGLTATHGFPRKTFQKGREKTTSFFITSHLDTALFPFHASVREENSSHLQGRRSRSAGASPLLRRPRSNKLGAWGPGDCTDLRDAGMAGARPFSSATLCSGDGPISKTVACCYCGCVGS